MCGIAGIVDLRNAECIAMLNRMATALANRGPDGNGVISITSRNSTVGLAHTRLAIQDLTENGAQPMNYREFWISFNGEIYNFKELRLQLAAVGHNFQTESDTEVVLHAFSEWGESAFEKFVGMFAIALLDGQAGLLYLVRDRLGVKPLCYYSERNRLIFGSHFNAIKYAVGSSLELDSNSAAHYFQVGVVPGTRSIYRNCGKIAAGSFLKIDVTDLSRELHIYWNPGDAFYQPKLRVDLPDATDRLNELLVSSCRYRMISDVPYGVFLSGGYDSSTVAAIMSRNTPGVLKTFTVGFHEGNNEAIAAKQIAAHLGTDHHEIYCDASKARPIIEELPDIYDEPFGDSSAIPTILVSRLAREHVKVAISADGGDELFAGYSSYVRLSTFRNLVKTIPRQIRGMLGHDFLRSLNFFRYLPGRRSNRLYNLFRSLTSDLDTTCERYHILSQCAPHKLISSLFCRDLFTANDRATADSHGGMSAIDRAILADSTAYLPDDILVKVDRATMSVGLEGREPLLDHRLYEFAASLPIDLKFSEQETKRVLRAVAHRYIPKPLLNRPKSGFSVPVHNWLRTSLSDLFDDICFGNNFGSHGLYDINNARAILNEFKQGKFWFQPLIWRIFAFELWHAKAFA
jgi:asparagine synthase (glutamine-hydrolysing)